MRFILLFLTHTQVRPTKDTLLRFGILKQEGEIQAMEVRDLQNQVDSLKERLFRSLAEQEKARILMDGNASMNLNAIVHANEELRNERDIIKATAEGRSWNGE